MSTKNCYKGYINNGEIGFAGEVTPPNFRKRGTYEVGDAVVWDTRWEMFRVVPPENIELLDKTAYVPTGVIAIPSSHNVYNTGEAGVVSLLDGYGESPDTGSNTGYRLIYWGGTITYYNDIKEYSYLFKVGISSGEQGNSAIVDNSIVGSSTSSYLPSDNNNEDIQYTKAIDGTYYSLNDSNWNNCLPSPYLADGSRNPVYYQTDSPATSENALSDFAGKSNTEYLCSKSTRYPNWKTDKYIITGIGDSSKGHYPAACICWRYHTVGTNQGDWYLPACGELGYAYTRLSKIDQTIETLSNYFKVPVSLLYKGKNTDYQYYWCSSAGYRGRNEATAIGFSSGIVISRASSSTNLVARSFTRLK